jgi:tRNA modification GTPase
METDTIAAIATPLGTGGISIIKISGAGSLSAVEAIFQPRNPKRKLREIPRQTMIYGHIHKIGGGEPVDEVLVAVLRGPHSFTGEDVVEINCHGGPIVTRIILDLLLESGIRLAEPGEFTRRAFLNGRIDLPQAEATIDLIHARTQRAARLGSRMLKDGMGQKVQSLLKVIDEARIHIEAAIEFGEETDLDVTPQDIQKDLRNLIVPDVQQLINAYQQGEWVRHGLRVVLAGKPNVGKSSLMNQLLRQERVIVTEVAGTTRDTIEEGFEIDGVPILLTDTAGLRRSADPIEMMGQAKAQRAIEQADLILFMIDGSQPLEEADRDLAEKIDGRPRLILRNKSDLVPNPARRTGLDRPPPEGYLDISALKGDGLERLKNRILAHVGVSQRMEDEACLPNRRQKELLEKIHSSLAFALESGQTLETLAIDLRDCEGYFKQILGIDVDQDVLDAIFQRFCIGK